jgi:hypothetical protein
MTYGRVDFRIRFYLHSTNAMCRSKFLRLFRVEIRYLVTNKDTKP